LKLILLSLIPLVVVSCVTRNEPLPYYGYEEELVESSLGEDSIASFPKKIQAFEFINQDSQLVTNSSFEGKIYVTDFFFISCPTICPKMKQQMLRVYEEFENEPQVALLSHSIDTRNDTVSRLKKYAEKLEIKSSKWNLVTGLKEDIYSMAEEYIVPAQDDESAPGGYLHSGQFVLIDKDQHIRGYYDGTVATEVDLLIADIKWLLDSEKAVND